MVLVQAVLILTGLAVSGFAARHFFERQYLAQVGTQLHDGLLALSRDLPPAPPGDWCEAHARETAYRFTVLSREGKVVCDSHHDASSMESHADRPEIRDALRSGFGESVRFSSTLREDMLYAALPAPGAGLFLRGAIPLPRLAQALHVFDVSLGIFLFSVALLLLGFAAWTGRMLVFPIGRLLGQAQSLLRENPETLKAATPPGPDSDAFGEWEDLETSLETIRTDLRSKIESLLLQREEQATLMSAISDAIVATDSEEALLFYNSRFAVSFDVSGPGRKWRLREIFRDPEILEEFRAALQEGRSSSGKVISLDGASGRRFYSLSVAPLRKHADQVYGAVGIFHDVTDLKRAEQIRIDFVANVSHELRTPLTSIKGYADTLLEDIQAGKMPEKQYVDTIVRNAGRLMNLIQDLLDLSSIESTDVLQKSPVHTEEITRRSIEQMKGAFAAKGQKVEFHSDVPSVFADPKRLEQVLTNLLDNARKYTPAEGRISVSWTAPAGAKEVLLKVSDTGPGIPPEHHSRLFERFYRVDKGRSRDIGGTGLGLAIVKHIMQRHEGAVWVESAPGAGCTFVCRFPGTPAGM